MSLQAEGKTRAMRKTARQYLMLTCVHPDAALMHSTALYSNTPLYSSTALYSSMTRL